MTQTPPIPIPVGLPSGATLGDRYDESSLESYRQSKTLDDGPPPLRIPRLWNMSLGSFAGLLQFGHMDSNYRARIPPPVIVPPIRTSARSVGAANAGMTAGRFADRLSIPAIFVGWNPFGQTGGQ